MGNNHANPSLREEERSKLETKGKSVTVGTTQEQVFLAGQGKDGDKDNESSPDGNISKETPERKPQSNELVKDMKLKNVEEEMHQSVLESTVMKTDENLQTQTSVTEEVEELCVVSKLKPKESGNDSLAVDIVPAEEKKMKKESSEKIVPAEEVVKLEQRKETPEIEPKEILNLEHRIVVDDDVSNEVKADKVISKPSSQESNRIQDAGLEVYKEEKDMEQRSVPVSHNDVVTGDSMVQADKGQEVTEAITESNKEPKLEMRSTSFGNETTDKTPLLSQEKTVDVEMSLGLLNKQSEGDDKVKDKKGSGDDDLLDKKVRVTKRSSSSLLGSCLCCGTN